MVGPRPILPARWLIWAVLLILPADARERYREEFRSELAEMGAVAQIYQGCGLLVGSVALRNALTARDVPEVTVAGKTLRCRVGRHRYVLRQSNNPEMRGVGFLKCVRCGKEMDPPEYGPGSAVTIAVAGA